MPIIASIVQDVERLAAEGWAGFRRVYASIPPRTKIFYLLLLSPIFIWALIVAPGWVFDDPELPKKLTYALVFVSPVVSGDISIFGQVTPVILAGAIISLLPKKDGINFSAIVLAAAIYVLYIYLGWFFADGAGSTLIDRLWHTDDEKAASGKTILSFVANIRTMALVVAASIIGLRVRETT
jgi:hypothetical protein